MQQIEKRLIRILETQIERNLGNQPEQALDLCEELLRFSVEKDDAVLYGEAVLYRGKAYLSMKRPEMARTNFDEALTIFTEMQDDGKRSMTLNALGAVEQLQSNWNEAIKCYYLALQAAKQTKGGESLYKPLVNLAQLFMANHTYSKALMYAQQAIVIAERWNIDQPRARLYHMAAKLYEANDELNSARKHCIEAIRYAEAENEDTLYATSSMTLAQLEVKFENHIQAETLLRALMLYCEKRRLYTLEALSAVELVKLWFRRGNHKLAFTVLNKQILNMREHPGDYDPQCFQIFKLIGDYCRFIKQDIDAANRYYRLYLTLTRGVWKRYLTA